MGLLSDLYNKEVRRDGSYSPPPQKPSTANAEDQAYLAMLDALNARMKGQGLYTESPSPNMDSGLGESSNNNGSGTTFSEAYGLSNFGAKDFTSGLLALLTSVLSTNPTPLAAWGGNEAVKFSGGYSKADAINQIANDVINNRGNSDFSGLDAYGNPTGSPESNGILQGILDNAIMEAFLTSNNPAAIHAALTKGQGGSGQTTDTGQGGDPNADLSAIIDSIITNNMTTGYDGTPNIPISSGGLDVFGNPTGPMGD
jgi:hypothetical protein